MWPQLYRCGNLTANCVPVTYVSSLQWGRNFIVAETQLGHLHQHGRWVASMGPQLYRCGNLPAPAALAFLWPASMGPQLYRCGNAKVFRGLSVKTGRASMGPQLYRCGNLDNIEEQTDRMTLLQWGRNFIVAETCRPRPRLRFFGPLQWGRNFIVAETWTT